MIGHIAERLSADVASLYIPTGILETSKTAERPVGGHGTVDRLFDVLAFVTRTTTDLGHVRLTDGNLPSPAE